MPLDPGSVTVAADLTRSGTGAALQMYDGLVAKKQAAGKLPTPLTEGFPGIPNSDDGGKSIVFTMLEGLADQANQMAALIQYLMDNCDVIVTIRAGVDGGLQTVAAVPTNAPAADATIHGILG